MDFGQKQTNPMNRMKKLCKMTGFNVKLARGTREYRKHKKRYQHMLLARKVKWKTAHPYLFDCPKRQARFFRSKKFKENCSRNWRAKGQMTERMFPRFKTLSKQYLKMYQQFISKCVESEQKRANGLHGVQNENNSLSQWVSIVTEEVGEAGADFLASEVDKALIELVQVAAVSASAKSHIMQNESPDLHFRDWDFPKPFVYATGDFKPERWMLLTIIKLGNVAKQVNEVDVSKCVIEFAHLEDMAKSAVLMLLKHSVEPKPLIKALENFCEVKFE